MKFHDIAHKTRKPAYPIADIFYTRWSPRAMTGEPLTKEELLPLFEAARWAPSSYNGQPWRFVVATAPKEKELFMSFLVEFNQQWCKNASALVVICARKNFEHNNSPNPHHVFDTGSAWVSLALEGARRGLVVHGMAGYDQEKVRKGLHIPAEYDIAAMCAIGKFADPSVLPPEIAKTEGPNQRKTVDEIVGWGKFSWK